MHFERMRRRGKLDLPTRAERFWSKVPERGEGCWLWTGGGSPYGYFWDGNKHFTAHRYAYTVTVGPIPAGLTIDHLCNTTLCVRPDHLVLATRGENMLRGSAVQASAKARKARPRCRHGHLRNAKNSYVDSNGYRACRVCKREQMRGYRAAHV